MNRTFDVRLCRADELVDLRWRILRDGLPREEAMFAGDDADTSLHVGAFENPGGVARCCATFHLNQWEGEPAYQLRGMASDDGCRGLGLGRRVLELAERHILLATPIRQLWANARTPALRFYERLGWEVKSEVFEIPTAGPHVRIAKLVRGSSPMTTDERR